jgi:uracil-DNA glycosylase
MGIKKISGIGNYLLAEGLYRAKIDPFCSLTELSEDQQRYLLRELQATALESYDRQGLTRRAGGSYRDVQGNRGTMESMLQCYGRTTCSRGMPVIQEINGPHGRTIWYTEEQLFRPRSQRSTCSPTDDEDFSDKDVSPMKESVTKSSQHLDPPSGSVKYSKPRLSPSEVSTESSNTRLTSSGQAEVISDLASFLIDESWRNALSSTIQSKEMFELTDFLRKETERNAIVYPPEPEIFAALNLCPLQDVKVVIVGQDPYHGPGQSHGLSFSVRRGIRPPPSLQNIFLEAQSDVGICKPNHGDLTCWVQQGVLLLNSVLTVRAGEANSHSKKGWEVITDAIIKTLNEERNGLVFLLWGNPAHLKASNVDETRHTVIRTSHPSPLGAMKTNSPFLGSKCFSQTNEALEKYGKKVIDWSIQ